VAFAERETNMMDHRFSALGEVVAGVSDRTASSQIVLADARRRLLERSSHPAARLRGTRVGLFAVVACVTALATASYFEARRGPAPVTFELADGADVAGEFVSVPDRSRELRFSDGTRVELAAGTSLRVVERTPRGANLVVERGRARARVARHTGDARWNVGAGPYRVRVTGTDFEIAWAPETGSFELSLYEGAVRVSGPGITGQRDLEGRQTLKLAANTPSPRGPAPKATAKKESVPAAPATSEQAKPPPEKSPTWRERLRAGQTAQALTALERGGAERALSSATPEELWAVADAARLSGRSRLAQQALMALRKIHGARGQSGFLLGKIAADQFSAPSEATRWFETYLRESPEGAFAEQALGRLVELYGRLGSPAARKAAQRYVERYPNGAYSDLARRTLEH
jgi:hypothetical protein